jgi:hypothetical protein
VTVVSLAEVRARKMVRCAVRGHDFDDDGKGVCARCGLTVNR